MHPPSRARRILKWTGVGLSLLILADACLGIWVDARLRLSPYLIAEVDKGRFGVAYSEVELSQLFSDPRMSQTGLFRQSRMTFNSHRLWGIRRWPQSYRTAVDVAFWIPLLLTAVPTAWLWHRDRRSRRIRPGCCLRCGYDLTGNTSGVCSECGKPKLTGDEKFTVH